MSNLSHSFSVVDAEKHGIPKAVLLHNFRYWLDFNQKTGRGQKDGTTWCYLTSEDIVKHHSYMSQTSVKRWLSELTESGELIREAFGKKTGNHTYWYTMPQFMVDQKNEANLPENLPQAPNLLNVQNGQSNVQNGHSKNVQNGHSLNSITKTLNNNIYIYNENEFSEADKIQNQLDDMYAKGYSKDEIAVGLQNIIPDVWIKKCFIWKGITEDLEMLDVLESFLVHARAKEQEARDRSQNIQAFNLLRLQSMLTTWTTNHKSSKSKPKKRVLKLSAADQFKQDNPDVFSDDPLDAIDSISLIGGPDDGYTH